MTISPLAALAAPSTALQIEWVGGQTFFEANVFTDGSGLGGTDTLAVRCGFGCAQIDDHGAIVAGCFDPLPGELQTVPGAEVLAVSCAIAASIPPLVLYTDHFNVLRDLRRGPRWCMAAERPFAAQWAAIWTVLEDVGVRIGNDDDVNDNLGWAEGFRGITVCKVPAHFSAARAAVLGLEWRRQGNEHADDLAKRRASPHSASEEVLDAVRRVDVRVEELAHWVHELHRLTHNGTYRRDVDVPPAPLNGRRRRAARECSVLGPRVASEWKALPPEAGGHIWRRYQSGWACSKCGASTRQPDRFAPRRCLYPLASRLARLPMPHRAFNGHRLWTADGVTWCSRCALYAEVCVRGLGKPCLGHPVTPWRMQRIRAGKHPGTGALLQSQPRRLHGDSALAMGAQQSASAVTGEDPVTCGHASATRQPLGMVANTILSQALSWLGLPQLSEQARGALRRIRSKSAAPALPPVPQTSRRRDLFRL